MINFLALAFRQCPWPIHFIHSIWLRHQIVPHAMRLAYSKLEIQCYYLLAFYLRLLFEHSFWSVVCWHSVFHFICQWCGGAFMVFGATFIAFTNIHKCKFSIPFSPIFRFAVLSDGRLIMAVCHASNKTVIISPMYSFLFYSTYGTHGWTVWSIWSFIYSIFMRNIKV